jgi:hypothetical protein
MKQKKEQAKTNGHVTYTVTFVPSETVYLKQMDSYRDRNHYATVLFDGRYYYLIAIDGRHANSLSYSNPKAAVKNGWLL